MPIVFTKDLVKQFLVAGLSNPGAVIWIYFGQINAMTHEEAELGKNVKDLSCQIESGKNGNWELSGFKKDRLRPGVASPVMKSGGSGSPSHFLNIDSDCPPATSFIC
jgi:hypothetical protein